MPDKATGEDCLKSPASMCFTAFAHSFGIPKLRRNASDETSPSLDL